MATASLRKEIEKERETRYVVEADLTYLHVSVCYVTHKFL